MKNLKPNQTRPTILRIWKSLNISLKFKKNLSIFLPNTFLMMKRTSFKFFLEKF